MTPPVPPQLHYRADLDLFTVRWLAEHVDFSDLRAQYEDVLAAGLRHHTRHWLLDVRRRAAPTPEVAVWVASAWVPRVVQAVAPQRLRMAFLLSPMRDHALRHDPVLDAWVQQAQQGLSPVDLRMFGDEGQAVAWLLSE